METPNPFLEMEPDAECPPHLKAEIFSEIDLIRDFATVTELYVGHLFGVVSVLANPAQ
ncbi:MULTISPECIES: hypothetical protein [Spirosoma]|uniref:Uncharacterized protein n=1 Tax=Spirosoma liriopis TaxID=2937440 RepID=A0ABT0HH90_9BACT|nr:MULTISPECIES: hypothetical protein [Spirosoma]MCK8491508.1 hypothetical protein [Spirosoma liriopis]UHG90874.1 hypothetical protein LQ777_21845 [Spirosoma oryzicola]